MSIDDREIAERLQYFAGIAAKYGFQTVPALRVYEAFEAIAQPTKLGFSAIKTGLYGRVVSDDIVHLMKLQALKGLSYSIWWGVSLAYLPHKWSTGLRWHRSFKASRFDLFETPPDYLPTLIEDWREFEKYIAHTLYGESYLKDNLQMIWGRLGQEILRWLSSTQSLADVLQKTHEQAGRKWAGPHHHPNPLVVSAFTLGRMGRTEEARVALGKFFQLGFESPEAQENLKKALEKISTG